MSAGMLPENGADVASSLEKRPSEDNPRVPMGSWARRTGFKGMEKGSGNSGDIEINLTDGTHIAKPSEKAQPPPLPIVRDTTPSVVRDTARSVVRDTAFVRDTTPPAVRDPARPVVRDTTRPVVRDTTPPAVRDPARPVLRDTTPPVVKDTARPVLRETAAPVVMRDLEMGKVGVQGNVMPKEGQEMPKPAAAPVRGVGAPGPFYPAKAAARTTAESENVSRNSSGEVPQRAAVRPGPFYPPPKGRSAESDMSLNSSGQLRIEPLRMYKDQDDAMSGSHDDEDHMMGKESHMKYELRESPGLVPLIFYAIQHYLSIVGSIILIPLILVPAMGGTPEDTAKVVSSMLMVSGLSTLLHTSFGSRLPLIQGASFVYLAPALAITFSPAFVNHSKDRFKITMKELQGAMIIGSAFQAFLGYSGIMSLLLRVINPVVVAPTITAVGLAFYAYGFPVVGRCLEIGVPQIVLLVLFALYLRKITVFGHRIFQVYAVPLGLALTWAYAFLLTESKVYTFKGCSLSQQGNTTLTPACQQHMSTMLSCRTDVSNALSSSAWFRIPYPFQWGIPTFSWETAVVMMVASVISSVDSVGAYHAASLLVASRAPPPGVVSRSIGLEGLTGILAGFWGTGSGASTLTENVHTIAVTKMGSRRAVELGAFILILLSVVGKISGFIAQIPLVIVAALLVFMWTMLAAMGLSNLRYSETGSSRNVLIVGLSLFLSLSVPSYFQQYGSDSRLPSYFQPYDVAAHGPFHTGSHKANFALNTIFSLHMVIAFLVAFVLDNTVPGSRQERGLYVWSTGRTARNEPAVVKDYGLPFGLSRFFLWVRWVGL